MKTLLQTKTYFLAFFYFKYILIVSSLISLVSIIAGIQLIPIVIFKFFLFTTIYFIEIDSKLKQRLTFYHNLGISKQILYFISFIYDIIILAIFELIKNNI